MRENVLPRTGSANSQGVFTTLLALAVVLLMLGAACGGGGTDVEPEPDPEPEPGAPSDTEPGVVLTPPSGATQVEVSLKEFSITPDTDSVAAGQIYFLVSNDGGEPHEFVVIKTDAAPGDLPVVDGRVPEDEVDMIGEIEPFAAESQASVAFDLASGSYVFICNIAEEEADHLESHYEEGMYTAFTVE